MERIDRDWLYDNIWSQPATKLVKTLGVSTTTLRDICIALNVPRPDQGYWAKLNHGKQIQKKSLPDAKPNSPIAYLTRQHNVWHRSSFIHSEPTVDAAIPSMEPLKDKNQKTHPLLTCAKEALLASDKQDDFGYFRYRKGNLPYLLVGQSGLNHAIEFANRLFNAFEKSGCPVCLKEAYHNVLWSSRTTPVSEKLPQDRRYYFHDHGWQNPRATVVWVGCIPFVISIYEQCSKQTVIRKNFRTYLKGTEPKSNSQWDHGYETSHIFVDGRIGLYIESGLSCLHSWSLSIPEVEAGGQPDQIDDWVQQVITQAPKEVAEYFAYIENQKALNEQRRIRDEQIQADRERERVQRMRQKTKANLLKVIEDWAEAESIHQFFDGVESRIKTIRDPRKSRLEKKLKQARSLIEARDPMEHFKRWNPPVE